MAANTCKARAWQPQSSSGVFELDLQPEMRLPFEAVSVDNVRRLELPTAADHFDYGTVADVLLSIEYTALASRDLRQPSRAIIGSCRPKRLSTTALWW